MCFYFFVSLGPYTRWSYKILEALWAKNSNINTMGDVTLNGQKLPYFSGTYIHIVQWEWQFIFVVYDGRILLSREIIAWVYYLTGNNL